MNSAIASLAKCKIPFGDDESSESLTAKLAQAVDGGLNEAFLR